jgi:hypothetical protein
VQLFFEGQKLWLGAGREGSSSTADTGRPTEDAVYAHPEKAGNDSNTRMGSGYFDQERGDSGPINDFLADYF